MSFCGRGDGKGCMCDLCNPHDLAEALSSTQVVASRSFAEIPSHDFGSFGLLSSSNNDTRTAASRACPTHNEERTALVDRMWSLLDLKSGISTIEEIEYVLEAVGTWRDTFET